MAGQVLIYDGISANRIILRCKLSAACYEVLQADSLESLRAKAALASPEIVILDGDEDLAGSLRFCREMKAAGAVSPVPILLLVSNSTPSLRVAALNAGAWEVLSKPLHDELLMATLRRFLRQRQSDFEIQDSAGKDAAMSFNEATAGYVAPSHVALVTPSPQTGASWISSMADRGHNRFSVVNPTEALSSDKASAGPDVFVIKAAPKQFREGLRLLSDLRCRVESGGAKTIVVLGGHGEFPPDVHCDAAMALDLGADDVLLDGFQAEELLSKIDNQVARKRRSDKARKTVRAELRLANLDPLTGLYNRRYAFPRLERMISAAKASGSAMALMMLDLDRFKSVNDTYGHSVGDAVLVDVARHLTDTLRPQDLIARVGGEEFVVALPDTGKEAAARIAQRLRDRVRSSPVTIPGHASAVRVTLSIGVSVTNLDRPTTANTATLLMNEADHALLSAKSAGRDKVTLARPAA